MKYFRTDVPGFIKQERGLISPEKTDSLIAYKKQKEFYKKIKEQEDKIEKMEFKIDKILEILSGFTEKQK
jgi:hypothetical protein